MSLLPHTAHVTYILADVRIVAMLITAQSRKVFDFGLSPRSRWISWLRHCATSRKVAGLIPDGVIGIFHWRNPSGRTMALGSTQPLTEISARNISCGVKAAGVYGWQIYHLRVPIVVKSVSVNLLEHWGPVQACTGIALPLLNTEGRMMTICGCKERIRKSACDIRSHGSYQRLGGKFIRNVCVYTCICSYITTRRHKQEVTEVQSRRKARLGKHWSTTDGQISGRKKPDGLDGRLSSWRQIPYFCWLLYEVPLRGSWTEYMTKLPAPYFLQVY